MLPFFNKYPYTNFEQLNLDWMMNTIGSFDARITKNTEDIHTLDIRVTVAESDIDDLQDRMTTAEGKIENLETVVGDSSSGLVKDVDDLQNVVGDEYGGLVKDVDDLQNVVGDDNSGLVKDVNDLESSVSGIPVVVANPAGTPTGSLVTLGIDDDIYTISGGGGGSGTEVIANPTGTPAADLETVSIAGIIYDIPNTDITSLTARVSDLETTVGDSSSGLVKDVDDLETIVGDSTSGLVKDVDDLENVVGDSTTGLVKDVDDLENITSFLADDCLYDSYSSITDGAIGVNYHENGHDTLPAGTYVGFTSYMFNMKPSVIEASNYLYEFYTATRQLSGTSNNLVGTYNYVLVPFNQATKDVTINVPVIIKSDGTTKLDCSYSVSAFNGAPTNAKFDMHISNRLIRVR